MIRSAGNELELRISIGQVAAKAALGAHRATYFAAAPNLRRLTVEGIGTVIAGVVAVLGIATGAAILTVIGITGVLMIGGRLLSHLLWMAYVQRRNRRVRLDLYEFGLVASVRGRPRAVRYDSTSLRRSIVELTDNPAPNQISHCYTVTDSGGDPIVLRHTVTDPDEWGPAIDRAVTDAQLPRATTMLDAGERLDFEHFWMTRTEIGAGHRSASWSEVSDIVVHKGWVSVHLAGESRALESLPVRLVPNFTLFWRLAQRMRAEYAGQA